MPIKSIRMLRILWAAAVAVFFALAYFGVAVPKDWAATLTYLAPLETWWGEHAAHPLLAAFAVGLFVGTVLLPELWRQVRPHLFPDKPDADLDAQDAFDFILKRSRWAKEKAANWQSMPRVMYEKDREQADVVEDRLKQVFETEIHRLLRNGKLDSWGRQSFSGSELTPEKPIVQTEWDTMQISFVNRPPWNHTIRMRSHLQDGSLAYVGLRLNRKQIHRQFPAAWRARSK